MIPSFETERLTLRPITLDDAPAAQRLFPRWEIVRFLGRNVPWPYPEDGALRFYRDVALPRVERGELWLWAIRLKGGPAHMIGCISLSLQENDNRGFWLGLPWHGQGIMREACEPVTDYWFNGLNQQTLRVAKAVGNTASRRISEKEGARLVRTEERVFCQGPALGEIWELTREEWNARRRTPARAA